MVKWNGNKFSVYDSEEKTALGLIKELGDHSNYNSEEIVRVEKENNNKIKNLDDKKTDKFGDHQGSWQGLNKPTLSVEGAHAQTEKNMNDIININNTLKDKVDFKDIMGVNNFKQTYLATFFNGNTNTVSEFYTTKDGIKFDKLNVKGLEGVRDGDIVFHNGKFYFFATQLYGSFTNDMRVFISENLEEWEERSIDIGLRNDPSHQHIWAPDLFIDDNGEMYVVVSKEVGTMVDSVSGRTELDFRPWLIKIVDLENLNFEDLGEIILNDNNKIDGHIEKLNNNYFLFIKKEMNENGFNACNIEIWRSTDLKNWVNVTYSIASVRGKSFEGPYIEKIGSKYFMYLDNYTHDNGGYIQYITSNNLIDWSDPSPIITPFQTRHGAVVKINSSKEYNICNSKEIVVNTNNVVSLSTNNIVNKYIELIEIIGTDNYRSCDIRFLITDTQNNFINGEFVLQINKRSNAYNIMKFYCVDNHAKLDFINSIKVIDCLNGKYKVMLKVTTSSTTLNVDVKSFISSGFTYKITRNIYDTLPSGNQTELYDYIIETDKKFNNRLERDLKSIDLSSLTSNGVIENLTIEQNTLYTCTSSGDIIINNVTIPKYDNYARVFFCVLSNNQFGKITIKKSSNVVINSDYIINYSNGNNEVFNEFIIHNGKLRRIH